MRTLVLISVCLGFVSISRLACTQSAQPTGSISGTVIDAVTRQPLPSVDVRARNLTPGYSVPHVGSATSDEAGHFVMQSLPEGRYFIFASHEGYVTHHVSGARGRTLVLSDGQHMNDVTIELTPGVTISGTIKSSDGKPLPGISVEAMRYFLAETGKQLRAARAPVTTDATGQYRISNLASGQYYLQAIPSTKSGRAKPAPKEAFAPTYYPNALTVATATSLDVHPGSDAAGMDMTLTPVHAVTVAGHVAVLGNNRESNPVEVALINNNSDSSQHEVVADAKGNFEIQGITAGDYTLTARVEAQSSKSKALWGQRPLHVGTTAVHNADLRIGTGMQLNGRIGSDEKSTVDFTHITVSLLPVENVAVDVLIPQVDNVNVKPDGSFTFNDVPEGEYLLDFLGLPQGCFLKSNATPDFLETGVSISNSQSPPTLDVVLSSDAPQINGSVLNDDMPDSGATVVLIPDGGRIDQGRFSQRAITDPSGRFAFKSIAPGDYKIIAFQTVDRTSLSDPKFIERFEDRSAPMHLREGDSPTISLTAVPADEAVP